MWKTIKINVDIETGEILNLPDDKLKLNFIKIKTEKNVKKSSITDGIVATTNFYKQRKEPVNQQLKLF